MGRNQAAKRARDGRGAEPAGGGRITVQLEKTTEWGKPRTVGMAGAAGHGALDGEARDCRAHNAQDGDVTADARGY
jgi:hypothetical protein